MSLNFTSSHFSIQSLFWPACFPIWNLSSCDKDFTRRLLNEFICSAFPRCSGNTSFHYTLVVVAANVWKSSSCFCQGSQHRTIYRQNIDDYIGGKWRSLHRINRGDLFPLQTKHCPAAFDDKHVSCMSCWHVESESLNVAVGFLVWRCKRVFRLQMFGNRVIYSTSTFDYTCSRVWFDKNKI